MQVGSRKQLVGKKCLYPSKVCQLLKPKCVQAKQIFAKFIENGDLCLEHRE